MVAPAVLDFHAYGAAYPWLAPFFNALSLIVGLSVVPLSWLVSLVAALLLVVTHDRVFNSKSAHARQKVSVRAYVQDLAILFVQSLLFSMLAHWHLPASWQDLAPVWSGALRDLGGVRADATPSAGVIAAFLLVVFLVGNLFTYLAHRLMHAVPCLWELHKFHHSAPSLSVFSGFREHPLAVLLSGLTVVLATTLVAVPFLVLYPGLASSPDLFTGGLLGFVAFKALFLLTHFHRPISYGMLDAVFVSPAVHSIHHSNDPRHFNRNFGANITLWDRIFGTFHPPTPQELQTLAYGLGPSEQADVRGYVPLRYLYLSTTWRAMRAAWSTVTRRA